MRAFIHGCIYLDMRRSIFDALCKVKDGVDHALTMVHSTASCGRIHALWQHKNLDSSLTRPLSAMTNIVKHCCWHPSKLACHLIDQQVRGTTRDSGPSKTPIKTNVHTHISSQRVIISSIHPKQVFFRCACTYEYICHVSLSMGNHKHVAMLRVCPVIS